MKAKNQKTKARPGSIDRRLLHDTGAVLLWFAKNARRYRLTPQDHATRVWIIAAAERALAVGKNPGGLFVYLLREIAKGDFRKLSGDQYDRAKLRLRNYNVRAAGSDTRDGSLAAILKSLATKMGISDEGAA